MSILKILIMIPIIGIIINIIIPNKNKKINKIIGMLTTIISLYIVLYIMIKYNINNNEIQERDNINLKYYKISIWLDGISLSIIIIITSIQGHLKMRWVKNLEQWHR